ncbi:MAG: hypothetical protein ACYTXF_33320 [Nostoc sp.]
MTNTEKCLEILRLSNDGNQLSSRHLQLVQIALDGTLSELGQQELNKIHENLETGKYCDWFHGIEHLTQDDDNNVSWKGQVVECFVFTDQQEEAIAAEELAARCRHLEAVGAPLSIANIVCDLEDIRTLG